MTLPLEGFQSPPRTEYDNILIWLSLYYNISLENRKIDSKKYNVNYTLINLLHHT